MAKLIHRFIKQIWFCLRPEVSDEWWLEKSFLNSVNVLIVIMLVVTQVCKCVRTHGTLYSKLV